MENFTPWASLLGGALLGLSATLLMLFGGKTAGISGIIGGLLPPFNADIKWRITFLLGMILSPLMLAPFELTLPDTAPLSELSLLTLIIAGLLVGFGTIFGNGCTSGHGIIGIGRFSKRSLVATIIFISSAMLVVLLHRLYLS